MTGLSRRDFVSRTVAAATLGMIAPVWPAGAADQPALPIPPELKAGPGGEIALRAQPGQQQFLAGRMTPTYGINGPFLGPAIRVRSGDKVSMKVTNGIDQDITIYWHGLKIPADVDGGPYTVN